MGVKSRRKAREAALRALYEIEVGHQGIEGVLNANLKEAELPGDLASFARELVTGIRKHGEEIDKLLSEAVTEWDFDRIAAVDRNVMRIAVYELFHRADIPPAVSIDEAVELGKKYSTAESGRFINGVLGRILKDSPKAVWNPTNEVAEEREAKESEPELEEITLDAESDEAKRLARVGGWRLKSEDKS